MRPEPRYGRVMGIVEALTSDLGRESVFTDTDVTGSYAHDMMPLAEHGVPAAVVLPTTVEQVQSVVRICGEHGVPIVPRGAGSGLSGAANAIEGCVVLVMTKFTEVESIDVDNRTATVQPGVVNLDLRTEVEKNGLFYPPDPSSYDWCTVGGNLSTNAGGLCCVKYGVTTDSVLGLEVVLADGSLLRTGRRTVKGVAGYDLTKLFIGSEGTLGVITKATVSLRPLPQAPCTFVAGFADPADAGAAVTKAVRAGAVPSLLEIMDSASIKAAEHYMNTDIGASECSALLLGQSDLGGTAAMEELAVLERIAEESGATFTHCTDDLAEGRMLLQARRVVLLALETYGAWLTDDVCVPRTRIAELIGGCERISEQVGLRIAVVGHAGDGNMHPTIVYDPESEEELARAQKAFDEILEFGLSLGGTVTGEHGVGKVKREWLAEELGPIGLRVHRQIKQALDPGNLFNPGSMFALE